MRALLLLSLLPALGCADAAAITHTLALRGAWTRLVVGEDGGDLHTQSALGEITRRTSFDGEVIDIFDPLPGARERLLDVVESGASARVLAAGDDAFFDWEGSSVAEPLRVHGRTTGILGAGITEAGLAVLRDDPTDGCGVDWLYPDDIDTVALPAAACQGSPCVLADRAHDQLLVTVGGATWTVGRVEVSSRLTPGSICALDPVSGTHVVADGRVIEAYDPAGERLWANEMQTAINAIGDMGAGGSFALSSTGGVGGQIVLLDAETGDPLVAVDTPAAGRVIAGGGQGKVLGLLLEDELHVFQVNLRNGRGGAQ